MQKLILVFVFLISICILVGAVPKSKRNHHSKFEKKNPLMNGWQKVLYQLRKNKRNNFAASNENYGANEYSNFEEITPNDFIDFVDGTNRIASIPIGIGIGKRYFNKQSPIPYWQQDFYYHDFV